MRTPHDVKRRLDQLAEDIGWWFGVPKVQALEWLRQELTGDAEPYREVGVDMNWSSE